MIVFWLTAAGILALDLITKQLISSGMELHSSITLIPGVLNFTYIENDGAAWGILAGRQFLLQAFTIIVILGIIGYVLMKKNRIPKLELISFAMIVGGGLGNLIGRIFDGKVVDFIEFTFSSIFNIFNIADIGITIGCLLLVISMLIPEKAPVSPVASGAEHAEDTVSDNKVLKDTAAGSITEGSATDYSDKDVGSEGI